MPTTRLTKDQYDELTRAFRERPARYQHAARRAGVHFRTAKRAYHEGWERPEWARPIEEVLLDEKRAARAASADAVAAAATAEAEGRARAVQEREAARLDAAREASREAEGVRAALSNALSLMGNLGQLSKASLALTRRAADDLLKEVNAGKVSWKEAMPFIKSLSLVGQRATHQLKEAMEAMRLHLGKPEQLIGVVDSSAGATTLVDGEAAVADLGEERIRQVLLDLAEGNITEDVEAVIGWQVARTEGGGDSVH